MKSSLYLLLFAMPILAQTDLIFPWVTNNASFRGRLIVNNLNAVPVEVTLTAQREPDAADAVKTQTITVTIEALEQWVIEAGTAFDQMGEGSAFMVRLTSPADQLAGAFVNIGTQSPSASSPSQTGVFKAIEATDTWLFSYVYNGDGFSAPVVINLGSSPAVVTLYAYQGGARVAETQFTVQPGVPWADVTANVFPALSGEFFMVAHAEGAQLLASSFLFNELLEPAMANATPLAALPSEPDAQGEVSFASQIQPMLTASCGGAGSSCHLNGGREKGLVLDAGQAHGEMVNIKSTVISSETLIIPGNADSSYLFRKLQAVGNGVFYAGKRMPDGGTFFSAEQLSLFRNWILQGAKNN